MTKRQYLELMGIDVWQKRLPRSAPAANPVAQVNAEAVGQSVRSGSTDGAAVLADVRRSLGGGREPEAPATISSGPATNKTIQSPNPAANQEPAPEFYLTLSHFSGLTFVNLYPAGFATIPGNHQRFLSTLYYSLAQQKLGSEVTEFRWPMVKSNRISQSMDEARKVLGRHLQQCQPELIVFGLEAASLLGAAANGTYVEETVRDRRVMLVEDAEMYFREPRKRQDLWRFLKAFRQRLGNNQ